MFGTQNHSEIHRVHWKDNQSIIEKSVSQGSIHRQESLTNVNNYMPEVPSRKKSFNVTNRGGDELVFGQRNLTNNEKTRRGRRQSIETSGSKSILRRQESRERRQSEEKSGSQSSLRRQESLTNLSSFLQEDLNRKWSLNATSAVGEDLVFGQTNNSNNVDARHDRRQDTNQAWLERSSSQNNLRRQDSMSNLSNLQDDINSLLRDTTTTSSSNVQTTIRCDNTYINSGHRSNYQAIASSLLSEPAPR